MKKLISSFVLVGILGVSSAVAEENGAFVGIQFGYGSVNLKKAYSYNTIKQEYNDNELAGNRFGFVFGRKYFTTPALGYRFYLLVDMGNYYEHDKDGEKIRGAAQNSTFNINLNLDGLFKLISEKNLDFGVFVGASLGYVRYNYKEENIRLGNTLWHTEATLQGFDAELNLGLRANIAQKHGFEFYTRLGPTTQKKEAPDAQKNQYFFQYQITTATQFALRYTYSW